MLTAICRFLLTGMRRVDSVLFVRRRFAMVFLCIIVSAGFADKDARAWSFEGLLDRLDGPSRDDVEVSFVSWTYHEDRLSIPGRFHLIITLRIINRSSYYLNNLTYQCSFFDAAGNRIAKLVKAYGGLSHPALRPGGVAEWEFFFRDVVARNQEVHSKECSIVEVKGGK